MRMATITDAAKELGVSYQRLRRAAQEGDIPSMMLGSRLLVDVDEARETLEATTGVGIKDVAAQTGLATSAIRRAIAEGWMPYKRIGRTFYFQMPEVLAAIRRRMSENSGRIE